MDCYAPANFAQGLFWAFFTAKIAKIAKEEKRVTDFYCGISGRLKICRPNRSLNFCMASWAITKN